MANWAHIHNGVVYLINGVKKDNKGDNDVELTKDNIPGIRVTLTKVDEPDLTTTTYIPFEELVEVGDEYSNGKFIINNDKFNDNERKIDSYFEYKQYLNEQKAIDEINKGTQGWSCENAINHFEFYFRAESGVTTIVDNLSYWGLASTKAGDYNFTVVLVNDTTEEYHQFDTTDALLETASIAADTVLGKCNYKLTNLLSIDNISDLE